MKLEGLFTALITPFNADDSVDIDGLKCNIEEQIQSGVSGLVVLGSTGESTALSYQEKLSIIEAAVETTNKQIPLLVGTGTPCTRTTIEMTQNAKKMGADGALIVTPYYNKPTQEGIVRHFEHIAKETDFPLVAYNHPGRTATLIEPTTLFRIASIPQVIGVKEASSDLAHVRRIIEQLSPSFPVMCGNDPLTLSMMELGGLGTISIISNLLPAKMNELISLARQGEFLKAMKLNKELQPLMTLLEVETNPIPIKAAMHLMNKPSGLPRLPLTELSARPFAQMKALLKEKVTL